MSCYFVGIVDAIATNSESCSVFLGFFRLHHAHEVPVGYIFHSFVGDIMMWKNLMVLVPLILQPTPLANLPNSFVDEMSHRFLSGIMVQLSIVEKFVSFYIHDCHSLLNFVFKPCHALCH